MYFSGIFIVAFEQSNLCWNLLGLIFARNGKKTQTDNSSPNIYLLKALIKTLEKGVKYVQS